MNDHRTGGPCRPLRRGLLSAVGAVGAVALVVPAVAPAYPA